MISWQTPISRALTLTLLLLSSPTLLANDLDLGVLKFGTVNWELTTLQNLELDKRHGIGIKIHPMASNGATQIAFKSGSVDAIVSDWLWAMLQRSRGDKVVFVPFSSSIGSVMVAGDSTIQSLADLKGKKIGIAGGPLNKGWILLRAAAKHAGWDIKEETQQSFAAPPLLNQSLQRGQLDAVVTFWHYGARLENKGMRHLINLKELQSELGMKSNIPMLGYVFRADWVEEYPTVLASFQTAISESKNSLKDSTETWDQIKHLTKAKTERGLSYLRAGYINGIPEKITDSHVEDARAFYSLVQNASPEYKNTAFDPDVFWRSE